MLNLTMVVGTIAFLIPLVPAGASEAVPPKPVVIKLDMPPPQESEGGLIVADVDNDGAMDYLVTVPGHLVVHVYSNAEPNPRPDHKRFWSDRNYRRLKQTHNYYSP